MNNARETDTHYPPSIFIVDDAEEEIRLLSSILEEEGYETICSLDGSQAIALINSTRPDLILLDILMPGLDGFDVCRQLKDSAATRDIPVIFLSAKADIEDVLKGFRLGAADYVTKPFQTAELLARVNAQLELRRSREDLKRYAEDLKVTTMKADAALIAKDEFLAAISHEFRTPLNVIHGMTRLLLESSLDDKQKIHAEMLESSGNRLGDLISDILDYSQIEAGHLAIEHTRFNLQDVIDGVCKSQSANAEAKGLEFSSHIQPDTPTDLIGDPARLQQILSNIVSNAVKFTDAGRRNDTGGGIG